MVEKVSRTSKCGECSKTIRVGSDSLVSRRYGKVQKRVCSEECRLTFDDRYWQERANEKEGPGNAKESDLWQVAIVIARVIRRFQASGSAKTVSRLFPGWKQFPC